MLAVGAALTVSELLAAVFDVPESPLLAVAQHAVDLTPAPLIKPIIDLVGTADKPLAVAVTVVVLLALGAVAGRAWIERRQVSLTLVGGFTALGTLAVLTRPEPSAAAVVATVAGAAAALAVLHLLQDRLAEDAPDGTRRSFLVGAAVVLVGIVASGVGGQLLAERRRRRAELERARASLDLPLEPTSTPAGADLGIDGQRPWTTPNRDFYRIDTALSPPLLDASEWSLRIHGLVDREITVTYDDLVARGLTEAWVTLCCVSNEVGGDLIGNANWSGVPMADLLAEAGVQDGADCLLSTSVDGWTCGTPLEAVTDGRNALLAVGMNGEPLPVRHGFPVRQVIPGLYGYVSATKWVVDWEVTRFAEVEAYWTQRGWGERGPIKTQSRIDLPAPNSTVRAGQQVIAGVAWHQHTGISAVEVRVDEGDWVGATIGEVDTVDTWVQWSVPWDATPGRHTIEVRATDADGRVQTQERADVLPDGATGWHSVDVAAQA
ncbi:Tat pathway signal sequence domain protein [Aeromicrobium marinum DSM 15272]|uniref:Tat pathway signal sequence domain protein n=1 Tax=Aeromicrobium marinum DSM 15272 TaxID=585531 RepID=E2S7L5_9ACTN|nr:Tat pathway signal sequence domain protein [Aeromicrobium marinum DSM 15272]